MTTMDPSVFTGMGVSGLTAIEIAAQVTAGVGNADRLRGTGMSAQAAALVAAQINASITDPLVLSGFD
jgi:hypothetical protein